MQFPQGVLAILERGGQLVTANARSARDLRQLYGEHQVLHAGREAWASPLIYDWHSWLAEQWHQLLLTGSESRLLLSGLQEESVWATIIRQEVEARSLISPQEVARLAQNAWARLATYGGLAMLRQGPWGTADTHSDRSLGIETQEPELFRRWAMEFERRCQRHGWLSSALLPWVVAEAIVNRTLNAPAEIAWTGFDRTTPAESAIRAALATGGCQQSNASLNMHAATRRVSLPTLDQEFEACALWARDTLRENPSARVGVLLQNPSSARAQLDRIFRRVLTPESESLRSTPEKPVYEFTLGLPLGDVPMVRAALLFLQWMDGPIEREQISWLLSTGFFALSEDTTALIAADARLQQEELLPPEMTLDALTTRLEKHARGGGAVSRWTTAMRHARAMHTPQLSRERACRQWVETTVAALSAAGWPGTRAEDSVSYQVRDRWQEILEDVASLDFAESRLTYAAFLKHLLPHAEAALFNAESEGALVSISGVLESAGRVYDAAWVLQSTDEAWPIRSSAHSMLPRWLQAELGMPRGDAQQDAAFSSAVLERLQNNTVSLTFSHAHESANGTQRPAPLFTHFPEEVMTPTTGRQAACLAEAFEDLPGLAWPGATHEAGGQDTLKMQAACPFQAFAAKRLGARELRSSAHGLDAAQRGTLLHNVLQTLWNDPRMKSSAGLHAVVANNILNACIAEHVGKWLGRYAVDAGAWDEAYLQLEKQRLCTLIESWLLLELDRPAFEVENTEQKKTVDIHGLRLNIRLDRVDKLAGDDENAGRILIDYKTGDVHASRWMGPRIDEPQLPLYAIAGDVDGLQDVFFAQLRPGKVCFTGSRAESQELVSVNAAKKQTAASQQDFNAILAGWTEWLNETSRQFQEGLAGVDPKKGAETCKHCAMGGLCRIAESGRAHQTAHKEEL